MWGFYSLKTDVLVLKKKKNIFYNLNFDAFFPQLRETVKNAVEKYWELESSVYIQAINDFREIRQESLVKNLDFFSSQIKVDKHKPVIIRLGKNFVEQYLNSTLEDSPPDFKLSSLTPLEIKILNNFAEFLYKKINEIILSPKVAKISEKSEKNLNLILGISSRSDFLAQVVLSIPIDRIPLEEIEFATNFNDEDFAASNVTTRIRIGRSKITVEDLKNLQKEDIVLLEDSSAVNLVLVSGALEQKFKVKVNPDLIMNFDNEEEENDIQQQINNEVAMEKNLWDDIQIEISAEFDKVKMTLGELKQITKGQIVDLGSVFNNEISLYVENKKVAKGELLIINDKYAIKLNEVLSSSKSETQETKEVENPQKEPQPQPQEQEQQPQAPNETQEVEDEEFDYSDFEK